MQNNYSIAGSGCFWATSPAFVRAIVYSKHLNSGNAHGEYVLVAFGQSLQLVFVRAFCTASTSTLETRTVNMFGLLLSNLSGLR